MKFATTLRVHTLVVPSKLTLHALGSAVFGPELVCGLAPTSSRCRRAVSPYIWQDCKLAQALVILSRGWLVAAHSAVQCCLWELWLW